MINSINLNFFNFPLAKQSQAVYTLLRFGEIKQVAR
ncbi:protein of unknown function [Pseudodesulfovibrio piezophilus C1TLV30]|uniref:Uncharacterized protein n=1 Tax=Pseudodesulfovibrio piezophilus (strain DSM 21447 / JCM 15486 / C1TLV30) TaxID=1322246 RepID=M1WUN9_PSEP2|nr:protein of unknown function [Pseudodesulfovibrio piezophilus C1TLV30]